MNVMEYYDIYPMAQPYAAASGANRGTEGQLTMHQAQDDRFGVAARRSWRVRTISESGDMNNRLWAIITIRVHGK